MSAIKKIDSARFSPANFVPLGELHAPGTRVRSPCGVSHAPFGTK